MRKAGTKVLPAVLTAAMIAALLWAGVRVLERNYVFWNGALLSRQEHSISITGKKMRHPEAFLRFSDLRELDARDTGMTVAQYEWFRQELPDCRILWDVPVQGTYYSQDTTELHVEKLTREDMDALQYLPELEAVDVGTWDDGSGIRQLRQRYPGCEVRGQVRVAGEWWALDAVSMALENADPGELMEKLPLFEKLESILLTGSIPAEEDLRQLQEAYPQVFFLWKLETMGMTLETDLEELDLSGIAPESAEELESLLFYFPYLKQVKLNGYSLPREELVALAARHPDIRFVFDLVFGDCILSTDAQQIDISNTPLESTAAVEEILPCFHDLEKVIMCGCGISSEEMDALDRKYEDIRFVWSVKLAGMDFRTDSLYFTPNKYGISCDDENIADLRYCTDMVCVDIGHHVKVTNCEWVRSMPELKYLIIAETGISDLSPLEDHENLIYLELFLSKVKDYSVLTTCKALEDLNLCYTQGDPEPIGEMTWLKRLWWTGCWWEARNELPKVHPNTEMEFFEVSSTGGTWREGQNYYDMRDFIGMDYMTG